MKAERGIMLRIFSRLAVVTLLAAVGAVISFGNSPENRLYLHVTIVTGEHSRDSNSLSRSLTVTSGVLMYEETYHGARANRHQPVKKEYRLTKQDQAALIKLLKEKNLLVTKTVSKPPQQKGSSRYFELAIRSRLSGKESVVSIDASPGATELKTDRLYQGSVDFIEALYKIINRTDPDIAMPQLID